MSTVARGRVLPLPGGGRYRGAVTDEPGAGADAHDWRIYHTRARLRQLDIDQSRCTPRSAQWHAIQDEIDGLTQVMRDDEQAVPGLRRDEHVARRSLKWACVLLGAAVVLWVLAARGDITGWWWYVLAVLSGAVGMQQVGYGVYRWYR